MKYELTLRVQFRDDMGDYHSIDMLVADNLIQLLAQFNILIATTARKVYERKGIKDDDIPF